ncbi:MAG: hypothetical protein AB7J34_10850 [Limisphaerales bacterium]
MSDALSRSLSNSFRDVKLVSLASWSKAAEINPRDRGGPYLVLQEGYDPGDPKVAADEFLLGRSGKWLSLGLFYGLPVSDRREEFVYGTAAEVMQVLGSLGSKVLVVKPGAGADAGAAEAPAPDDELAAAIQAGKGSPGAGG